MEQFIKQISKISLSTFLVLLLLVVPFGNVVFGQTTELDEQAFTTSGFGVGASADTEKGEILTQGTSCLLASGVGNLIKGALTSVLGNVVSPEVPVSDGAIRAKETGGIASLGVSLDSLTFCLANTMIEYITKSTIAWAQGGFQGSPVFIEDPENFFRTIGDIEAGKFVTEITGSNLFCESFRPKIQINLVRNHTRSIDQQSKVCTLTDRINGVKDLGNYLNGEESGSWQDFFVLGNDATSNPNIAFIDANEELKNRIGQKQNTLKQELTWGGGFLSIKDNEGNITTPGKIIEGQLNDRLGSGQRRIEMADEFDELVQVLMDSIIEVAISEVFK
jgi:hypothetical protein